MGSIQDAIYYTYGNSNWGDLLTAYDGKPITYDTIGNPLTYDGWTFTWEHGRELASMAKNGTTWSFTYDANGLRTKRTNGTTTYQYVYNGSKLTQMSVNGTTVYFAYHANGHPDVMIQGQNVYHYITNLRGDVMGIVSEAGQLVVSYEYDAWGNVLEISGSMAETLGELNPLRYRGYVYDHETGLYYLQSRYYNPEWGRFLNADTLVSTGQGNLGNNMFAYCLNNPVAYQDSAGTIAYTCMDDVLLFSEMYFGACIGGGGGGSAAYGMTYAPKAVKEINDSLNEAKETVKEVLFDVATYLWDAYMRGYNLQQEVMLNQQLAQYQVVSDVATDVYNYVTDDGFWDTDIGVVTQSTLNGAFLGGGKAFLQNIGGGVIVFACTGNFPAAAAVVWDATLYGMCAGAIEGFVGGLIWVLIRE